MFWMVGCFPLCFHYLCCFLVVVVIGIKSRASQMLDKHLTAKRQFQSFFSFFFLILK